MMVHHGCVLLLQDFMHRRTLEFNMNVSKLAAQDYAAELCRSQGRLRFTIFEIKDILISVNQRDRKFEIVYPSLRFINTR